MKRMIMLLVIFFSGCEAPEPPPVAGQLDVFAFTASWCGPCQRQAPEVKALAGSGVQVTYVDIDVSPELAAQYGISAVPTYVIRIDGTERVRTHDVTELRRILGR